MRPLILKQQNAFSWYRQNYVKTGLTFHKIGLVQRYQATQINDLVNRIMVISSVVNTANKREVLLPIRDRQPLKELINESKQSAGSNIE